METSEQVTPDLAGHVRDFATHASWTTANLRWGVHGTEPNKDLAEHHYSQLGAPAVVRHIQFGTPEITRFEPAAGEQITIYNPSRQAMSAVFTRTHVKSQTMSCSYRVSAACASPLLCGCPTALLKCLQSQPSMHDA